MYPLQKMQSHNALQQTQTFILRWRSEVSKIHWSTKNFTQYLFLGLSEQTQLRVNSEVEFNDRHLKMKLIM